MAVLTLYEVSPTTQTRFPAYAHLNRLFVYVEMFKLCKAALAEAGKPFTTPEIALAVIRAKRWDEVDAMLRRAMAYRLIQSLTRAAMQGRISQVGKLAGVCRWAPSKNMHLWCQAVFFSSQYGLTDITKVVYQELGC